MFEWLKRLAGSEKAQFESVRSLARAYRKEADDLKHELGLLRAEVAFQAQTAKELGFELKPFMSDASAISALLVEIAPLVEKGRRYDAAQHRYKAKQKARRAAKRDQGA